MPPSPIVWFFTGLYWYYILETGMFSGMSFPKGAELPRPLPPGTPVPLYGQTAARLIDDLIAGGARPGDRLPSERVLSAHYRVSRVTLRAALAELADRGVVRAAPARGWFVADLTTGGGGATKPPGHTVHGFADYALQHGLAIRSVVLDQRVRSCTITEAEKLRIAPGSDLFEMRRLRYLNGLVVVVEHNRLPLALCPALATTDFTSASLYATLRAAKPAQLPRDAQYSVEARQPTAEERELLEVNEMTPMLEATQLAFNQDGNPLEFTVATYRGDRYRFQGSITD
jgi:GntR family transcriptional regulator